jgi:hypothetical protein
MSVLDKLASALERNDERPNVELAEALVAKPDKEAIARLADALSTGTVAVQNDAIKVLYEIGERAPELVAPHADTFFALLKSKNNRNVWGAMSAIDTIAGVRAKDVAIHLKDILGAADKGSVIAKDKAMSTLAKLAQAGEAKAMPALLERLKDAAPNQFPMYAELAATAVATAHKAKLVAIIEARFKTVDAGAKKARVEKVLRNLAKGS